MRTVTTTNYIRNGLKLRGGQVKPFKKTDAIAQGKKIRLDMKSLGVSRWGVMSMEGRYLAKLVHPGENLQGVVFGYQEVGFSMLVVTDLRVLFLDRKPLFMNEDEITFDVISGVTLTNSLFWTTVTLHTRMRDYKMLTFNRTAAERFADYVEYRCLEHSGNQRGYYD